MAKRFDPVNAVIRDFPGPSGLIKKLKNYFILEWQQNFPMYPLCDRNISGAGDWLDEQALMGALQRN